MAAKHPLAIQVHPVLNPVNPSTFSSLLEFFHVRSLSAFLLLTVHEYSLVETIYLIKGFSQHSKHNFDKSSTVEWFWISFSNADFSSAVGNSPFKSKKQVSR